MRRAQLSHDQLSGGEYATPEDFQKLFASEMVDMFRLAFLLTADAEKAERCLILTMHECMATRGIAKGWLPVWTRNVLVVNGIRFVLGAKAGSGSKMSRPDHCVSIHEVQRSAGGACDESAGILELRDFERLVYVICTLEHYPTRDCANLLGRSRQEVKDAQHRALAHIADFEREWSGIENAVNSFPSSHSHQGRSDFDCLCGGLLG